MTNVSNVADLSLADASAAITSRTVSPVELVEACLDRLEGVKDALRAYISVYADEAREVAKASETMMMAGHRLGPLHGVPLALKDNIALGGRVTTAGSKVLADWKPDEDATVTTRLKGAGAIIIGKTSSRGGALLPTRTTVRSAIPGTRSASRRAPVGAQVWRWRPVPVTAPSEQTPAGRYDFLLPSTASLVCGPRLGG
jgi:Asp-tRNA(Asn)/Glu-tRNA(Gln) amidotransferase A subunit family amidase